ncbi:MAG: T9SS type A sorting domain-containing protein [Bacteroidota bacterium]
MRIILFFIGLFYCNFSLQAQWQSTAIGHNPIVAKAAREAPSNLAKARSKKSAELPFFDDFAYDGPFPSTEFWTDNTVFINNTLANEPVSIGVATFDGLDATGSPYGGFGSADTLTSISLDLSGNQPKFMSYYVQPKGLGDAPGMEDSLILEFKNNMGNWIAVNVHVVTIEEALFPTDSLPNFQFIGPLTISDDQFLHDDFQFRFRNIALRTGAVDFWHVDYVRLEVDEISRSNGDLAFTTLPGNILRDYASAPWLHVNEELDNMITSVLESYEVNLFNHFSDAITISDSDFLVNGIDEEVLRFGGQRLLDVNLDIDQGNVPPGRQQFMNPIFGEYISAYQNAFETSDRIEVRVDYSFVQGNSESTLTQANNQVSRTFDLHNYYAYDDNSAESAYFVGTNGQVAVKFTNYKADLLQAIRMQIPRIVDADIRDNNFTLKVWLDDLSADPIYEAPFIQPLFIDEFVDSLQAFTTYVLKDPLTGDPTPVEIPVGDFYIGWQQTTGCANISCLPVGFDRNTPSATNTIFINVDGSFRQIGTFFEGGEVPPSQQGAMMIRPVVGSEAPNDSETVSINDLEVGQLMTIFPNPTLGVLNIQLFEGNYQDYQVSVVNTLGQRVTQQVLSDQLDLSDQVSGIYFLRFLDIKTQREGMVKVLVR